MALCHFHVDLCICMLKGCGIPLHGKEGRGNPNRLAMIVVKSRLPRFVQPRVPGLSKDELPKTQVQEL